MLQKLAFIFCMTFIFCLTALGAWPLGAQAPTEPDEKPDDPWIAVPIEARQTTPGLRVQFGTHVSVQVNVDVDGNNIVDDAANEPSIAIDPTNPLRMAIGWRQFDTITSNFRQAGYAYSTDGGATWTFPGVIDAGVFRSDPVLDFDAQGNFYYNSLEGNFTTDVFQSSDAGATWGSGVYSFGGDKQWMSIDRNPGPSQGTIYQAWYGGAGCCFPDMFTWSTDGGVSYETPIEIADIRRGTTAVGADSAVYVAGHLSSSFSSIRVAKSTNANDDKTPTTFEVVSVDLGGPIERGEGPNPSGMLGQIWVVAHPSDADRVYLLSSINPDGADPLDIHFAASSDGGKTWGAPVRVNDDPLDNGAWQWFGTLSVAPNGRLDVVWNDTRGDPDGLFSALYYSFSNDNGATWSSNRALTPAWDPLVGFPNQNKIGDYYEMISYNDAVHLAYAATFNGEQDVYYLRIDPNFEEVVLFADGFESGDLTAWTTSENTGFVPGSGRAPRPRAGRTR